METNFDLIIIGAGPGGYTGAIRAAQLGMKVAVIEKEKVLGGTCLNIGCIPSKALLDSSEHFADAKHKLSEHGVKINSFELDLPTMMNRKDKIVKDLTNGINFLFKKNKIQRILGRGRVLNADQVEVTTEDGIKTIIHCKNIMLATGSVPATLPNLAFDGKNIISSTEALALTKVPKHLLVVGAGAIGLEMGSVWLRLGAKVTVVEFSDKICGPMDRQLSSQLQKILEKQGFQFLLKTKVTNARIHAEGVQVSTEERDTTKIATLDADIVLVAAGRKPFSEGLGLEEIGIKKDSAGRVLVDHRYQTSISGIYAIGDLIPGAMLAHKAEEEGVAVAENLAGHAGHVNYETLPSVIYTWPELASVGLTEEQLKEKNIAYNIGTFPFMANGRAKALGTTDGLVKILADKKTDRVLGVHILGPRASDMLAEAVIAMEFGASSEDIARTFHAHPTLSEVIREAALATEGRVRQM